MQKNKEKSWVYPNSGWGSVFITNSQSSQLCEIRDEKCCEEKNEFVWNVYEEIKKLEIIQFITDEFY